MKKNKKSSKILIFVVACNVSKQLEKTLSRIP
ncbi:unnamed protein product, partial [marine sediment metagenome]